MRFIMSLFYNDFFDFAFFWPNLLIPGIEKNRPPRPFLRGLGEDGRIANRRWVGLRASIHITAAPIEKRGGIKGTDATSRLHRWFGREGL